MKQLLELFPALNVHKKQLTVCLRLRGVSGRGRGDDGGDLDDALEARRAARVVQGARGHTRVATEATGVYWKATYYALEDHFEVLLDNASHVKNVALV